MKSSLEPIKASVVIEELKEFIYRKNCNKIALIRQDLAVAFDGYSSYDLVVLGIAITKHMLNKGLVGTPAEMAAIAAQQENDYWGVGEIWHSITEKIILKAINDELRGLELIHKPIPKAKAKSKVKLKGGK